LKGEIDPIGIASRAEITRLLVENRDFTQALELFHAYFSQNASEEFPSNEEP
jgi:hypothetical protein